MIKRIVISLCGSLLAIFLVHCGNLGDATSGDPDDAYQPYDTPDRSVANFVASWNRMDIGEYRDRVLYDGIEPAWDGRRYQDFRFYFIRPDGEYGPAWGYEAEVEHSGALFSGEPGRGGAPGVRSVALEFMPLGEWRAPENPRDVKGDAYPEGTRYRDYATDLLVSLEDGGAFDVRDRVRFYVIPVDVDGATEYRVWKWMDLDNGE